MGAFNQWASGSFFAQPAERKAGVVNHNILAGAAYLGRVNALRQQGVALTSEQEQFLPKTSEQLTRYFESADEA